MATHITENFTLEELTITPTGLDNTPKKGTIAYSKICAMARLLQYVRNVCGFPLYVNSCYRSPAVNAKLGGARTSYHLYGQAVDLSTYHLNDTQKVSLENALRYYKPVEFIKYDTFWHVAFDISRLGAQECSSVTTWQQEYPELEEFHEVEDL